MSDTNYEILAQRSKKVIYKDGDTVLKVFDSDFSKADILNEALNQARIEETGLNVPKLLEVSKIDGKWAIRTEYIPGKTLAQLMEENPDKLDEYLDLFVNIQKEIFSKKAPLLNKIKDKFNRKISASRFDATTRYELHTRLDSMKNHKKICHGDFKTAVGEAVVAELSPIRKRYQEYVKDKKYIEECYTKSVQFVQRFSHRTVEKAMKKIGYILPKH